MNALLCVDCWEPLVGDAKCLKCGWELEVTSGFPSYLSTADRQNKDFELYQENYSKIATEDLNHSIQDPYYLNLQTTKFRSYIGNVSGLDICEVGVGQGILLRQLLKDPVLTATGVDISVEYLNQIADDQRLNLLIANAERLPFKHRFDLVTAADVLEHVFNPGDFLVSLNRCLRPGGRALVKVPYRENLMGYSRLLGCPYRYVHLRTYSKSILIDALEYAGFAVEDINFDGYVPERVRHFITRVPLLDWAFKKWVLSLRNRYQVGELPSLLCRLLMRPLEITVTAKKIKEF